jgi:hypothetical protein
MFQKIIPSRAAMLGPTPQNNFDQDPLVLARKRENVPIVRHAEIESKRARNSASNGIGRLEPKAFAGV